mmetsp:Transcript_15885/g.24055  ORF Transcript_15885/g.24055 Transcript_15885/m.24055 type:complete len:298 (+) Transcript_15885:274-1167(+)
MRNSVALHVFLILLLSLPVAAVSSSKSLLEDNIRYSPFELNAKYVQPPPLTQHSVRSMPLVESEESHPDLYLREDLKYDGPTIDRLSILGRINRYCKRLQKISPTLWFVSVICILVHVLWQVPICNGILSRHFISSRRNYCRPQSLLLSSISHSSSIHLLTNLIVYLSLGPTLQQTLKKSSWPFWPLVVGASLAGSCLNTIKGDTGCMGLSAITLSMLALQASIFPEKALGGVLYYVIPSHTKAKTILNILLVISVIGSFNKNSEVAHLAHIGGILFGMAYYQVWLRRPLSSEVVIN